MTTRLQRLVFDTDDTLWENNLLDFLAHSTLSRDEVRTVLDENELARSYERCAEAAGALIPR